MEVPQRASRQAHFTRAEQWALLIEFDKCVDRGSKTAFYQHVGVSNTTVRSWVKARAEGRLIDPAEAHPAKLEGSAKPAKLP